MATGPSAALRAPQWHRAGDRGTVDLSRRDTSRSASVRPPLDFVTRQIAKKYSRARNVSRWHWCKRESSPMWNDCQGFSVSCRHFAPTGASSLLCCLFSLFLFFLFFLCVRVCVLGVDSVITETWCEIDPARMVWPSAFRNRSAAQLALIYLSRCMMRCCNNSIMTCLAKQQCKQHSKQCNVITSTSMYVTTNPSVYSVYSPTSRRLKNKNHKTIQFLVEMMSNDCEFSLRFSYRQFRDRSCLRTFARKRQC